MPEIPVLQWFKDVALKEEIEVVMTISFTKNVFILVFEPYPCHQVTIFKC